jgi:hypothetical protein
MNVLAMTVLKSYSFSVRQHTFTYLEYMKMNHKEKNEQKSGMDQCGHRTQTTS